MKKQDKGKEQRIYERQLDEILISEVQNGKTKSLEKLYQRHQRSVYGISMGILGSHHDAEEVVQETFLQVWRKCMSYNPSRGAISTWIMTIGRSRALDLVRKRSRLERKSRDAALEKPTKKEEPTPESTVITSQEAGWLHEALDEIGISLREVISLAYFKGLSHSEISDESALSLGTVKWRIRVGTEKLGQVMRRRVRQRKRTPNRRKRLSSSEIRVTG